MVRANPIGGGGGGGDSGSDSGTSDTDLSRIPEQYRDDVREAQDDATAGQDTQDTADDVTAGGGGRIGPGQEGGTDPTTDERQDTTQDTPQDTAEDVTAGGGGTIAPGETGGGDASTRSGGMADETDTGGGVEGSSDTSDTSGATTAEFDRSEPVTDPTTDERVPDYYQDQIARDQPQSVDTPFVEENQRQRPRPGASAGDTPGDVIGTSVERSGLTYAPIDASSAELQRQARGVERQLLMENPNLGPREVDINLTRIDGEDQFYPEFTDQFRRERAASAYREQTGADVNVADIQLGDDGPQLRSETQREIAAERASEQTGADISVGDIVIEDGRARVSDEVQREITAERTQQQFEEQTGMQFDQEDIAVEYRDRQVFQSQQNRPTQVRQRGYFGELSDQGAAQVVASEIGLPESTVEAGEDFQRTDAGGIELTAEGRQRAIEAELIERGEVTVEREGAEIPVIGGEIGGGEETIDIRRPEQQLEFDEEGNLENVQPAEYTQGDIEANERRLAETIGFGPVGDVIAGGAGYLAKGTDVAADVSTDVGAGIQTEVINPTAELAGDIQSAYAETTDVINPLSDEFASQEGVADVVRSGGDIARGEEDEISEQTFTETATEKVTAGGLAPIRFGAELPATVQSGALVAGEAAQFTAESVSEEGFVGGAVESGAAAGGTAVDVGEQVAAQTIQNPFTTVGTLAGSGAIMGGAAAVGSRTGLATRAAIQPGEELLGYGGAGTLRRLPGDRTTRAAETLFPNNEPLLFSEEAAISAGQRAAGGARRVGQRVGGRVGDVGERLRFGEFAASERAQFGGQRGRPRGERDTGESDFSDLPTNIRSTSPVPARLDQPELASRRGARTRGGAEVRRQAGTETEPEIQEEIGAERPADFERRTFDPMTGRFETEADRTATEGAQQRLAEAQRPFEVAGDYQQQQEALGLLEGAAQSEVTATGALEAQQPRLDSAQSVDVLSETDTQVDTRARADTLQELRQDQETDQELQTETETETETEQELFQELETETETETEIESRFETEGRRRRERETDEDTEAEGLRPSAAVEEDVGAIFADFRDPLTGELLRTERENIGVRDI